MDCTKLSLSLSRTPDEEPPPTLETQTCPGEGPAPFLKCQGQKRKEGWKGESRVMAKSTENELKATRMMQENSVSKQMKAAV